MLADRVFSLIIVLFSIVYIVLSFQLPAGFEAGSVGTRALPLVYGSLLLFFGIIVFFKVDNSSLKSFSLIEIKFIALLAVLLTVYAFILEYLGFSLSTLLLGIFCAKLYKVNWKLAIVFSFIFTLCLVVIFIFLLGISLPIGTLLTPIIE